MANKCYPQQLNQVEIPYSTNMAQVPVDLTALVCPIVRYYQGLNYKTSRIIAKPGVKGC